MSLTKIQIGLTGLIIAGATTALIVQHGTQTTLRTENDALDARRRLTEHDDVGEFLRGKRELEQVGHALRIDVPLSRQPEQGLDHVSKTLSRRDLHADDRVHIGLVEPVVPHRRVDVGTLTRTER